MVSSGHVAQAESELPYCHVAISGYMVLNKLLVPRLCGLFFEH